MYGKYTKRRRAYRSVRRPMAKYRKLARTVRFVKSVVRAEGRYGDLSIAPVTFNAAGSIWPMNSFATGDSEFNRQGDSIKATYLTIHGLVRINPALTNGTVRMLLVRDKSNQNVLPAIGDVLQSSFLSTSNAPNAMRETDNISRFDVLYDRKTSYTQAQKDQWSFTIKKKVNSTIFFDGPNSSDWQKNSLFFIILDDNTTVLNENSIAWNSRLNFYP